MQRLLVHYFKGQKQNVISCSLCWKASDTETNAERWEVRFEIHALFGCFAKKDRLVYSTYEAMIKAKTIILQHD
jgi:hypothetical protein